MGVCAHIMQIYDKFPRQSIIGCEIVFVIFVEILSKCSKISDLRYFLL